VRRRSWGATLGSPTCLADFFTMCQIAFTEIWFPWTLPNLSTGLKMRPSLILAAVIQASSCSPVRNRNGADMSSLADQIHDGPAAFALFEISQSK
jgi:hypothetical protein